MEITKWEYIDLDGYVRSKQDPGRFFEIDRDPEGYSRKSKTEILNELGKKGVGSRRCLCQWWWWQY